MPYDILIPEETRRRLAAYEAQVITGEITPSARLAGVLATSPHGVFTAALLRTKPPQIYAETQVAGDGSDWNLTELGLLGDISVGVEVRIFDDGQHDRPQIHPEPLDGGLVFVPGSLLRNDRGQQPADWAEVVYGNGEIACEAYDELYRRRLLPGFRWIDATARKHGQEALVTIPGLGCGQFAGPFRGQLGERLGRAIGRLLERHGWELGSLRTVIFGPYHRITQAPQRMANPNPNRVPRAPATRSPAPAKAACGQTPCPTPS